MSVRDAMLVANTPIDYLDFASPVSGLGSKMGLDATNKWPGETQRDCPGALQKAGQVDISCGFTTGLQRDC